MVFILANEAVAKSIKALNHKEHKGKENLFFVLIFFSGPFATTFFAGMTMMYSDYPPLMTSLRVD